MNKKMTNVITSKESKTSMVFGYLKVNYKDESIIKDYSDRISISTRTVQKWFVNNIGISPEELSRIVRFHKSLSYIHNKEIGNFYYDQAHFIREFNEFTAKSPENYIKIVPDLYNNKN